MVMTVSDPTFDPTLMFIDEFPRRLQRPHVHSVVAGQDPTVYPTHPTPPHPTFAHPSIRGGKRWKPGNVVCCMSVRA